MWGRIFSVRPQAWWLLGAVAGLAVLSLWVRATQIISPATLLYIVQPLGALLIAGLTYRVARGQTERVRHSTEKSFTIASVIAIWFVLYFLSGLAVTYTHNALVSGPYSVGLNIVAYGLTAALLEYTRHGTMLLGGRRNVVWFGALVALVFALPQMSFGTLASVQTAQEMIELATSDIVPALAQSLLLTYLAIFVGLRGQLVFRLGIVAATILPPIIPKYDWYMLGVSALLLVAAVYIVMDRVRQDHETATRPRRHHPRLAADIMFVAVMVALVLFMTGIFSYKPVVIMSDSMAPLFTRGSAVVVERLHDPMDIQIGDIIQYEAENKTITHRVVAIMAAEDGSDGLVFRTKGDNSPSVDPLVDESHVIGVIRSSLPYVGYPTVWLKELSAAH